ncbi:hypothetical protein [Eikenella corrodens]|uniref:hypothetical protein n=1 Tax=Eikenella corrodens TaxID=539 RepID=UPI001EFFDE61|nr:hypothetical protein [Eikenella corrodens]
MPTGYLKPPAREKPCPQPSKASSTPYPNNTTASAAPSSNADQVLGETAAAEAAYTEHWRQHVTAHPDLSAEAKTAAFERIKFDRMATLSDQFQWLTTAGLPPTLYFQHYNFVVFAADKPQD